MHMEKIRSLSLPKVEIPPKLLEKTLERIEKVRARRLLWQCISAATAFISCLGMMIISFGDLMAELQTSSFFVFLRLAISDPDVIVQNAQNVGTALLETFPVNTWLIALLALTFLALALSLMQTLRHHRRFTSISFSLS